MPGLAVYAGRDGLPNSQAGRVAMLLGCSPLGSIDDVELADRLRGVILGKNFSFDECLANAGRTGDQAREKVSEDPVQGDVVAQRPHAPRIVANALEGQSERRT